MQDAALQRAAGDIYRETPGVLPPDRVVAVGVLRRNTTRALFNEGSFVPFAVELDVAQGTCEARFARERGADRRDHAAAAARGGPPAPRRQRPHPAGHRPRARREQRRDRAGRFFHEVIADACQRAERPLVLIDAVACRDVWPWVADTRLDPANVLLGSHPHAEADWNDARIVRVRTANAPKVLWDEAVEATGTVTGDVLRYAVPGWRRRSCSASPTRSTPVYFSFGSLLRTAWSRASPATGRCRPQAPVRGRALPLHPN